VDSSFEHGNEPSDSIKFWEILEKLSVNPAEVIRPTRTILLYDMKYVGMS
jgi:hypothetical protein